MFAFYIR